MDISSKDWMNRRWVSKLWLTKGLQGIWQRPSNYWWVGFGLDNETLPDLAGESSKSSMIKVQVGEMVIKSCLFWNLWQHYWSLVTIKLKRFCYPFSWCVMMHFRPVKISKVRNTMAYEGGKKFFMLNYFSGPPMKEVFFKDWSFGALGACPGVVFFQKCPLYIKHNSFWMAINNVNRRRTIIWWTFLKPFMKLSRNLICSWVGIKWGFSFCPYLVNEV